jgi:hypothetical protein
MIELREDTRFTQEPVTVLRGPPMLDDDLYRDVAPRLICRARRISPMLPVR